jgi:hypothetical protein
MALLSGLVNCCWTSPVVIIGSEFYRTYDYILVSHICESCRLTPCLAVSGVSCLYNLRVDCRENTTSNSWMCHFLCGLCRMKRKVVSFPLDFFVWLCNTGP